MEIEQLRETVQKEIDSIKSAIKEGNFGLARVCGRRAAGVVLLYWQQELDADHFGKTFISALRTLMDDATIPPDVRKAGQRFVTTVNEMGQAPITINPLQDARIIIQFVETQIEKPILPDSR